MIRDMEKYFDEGIYMSIYAIKIKLFLDAV